MSTELSITMTDGVASVVPGGGDTYTITVTNKGPGTVGSVTLTDALPAALSNPIFGSPRRGTMSLVPRPRRSA
jgi:uncharacterized repeat protein (TIGR01451 family)